MTKAIKFNLILDGKPVRNLAELQENFNIEDILSSYRSGLLKRWLETRGLMDEIAGLERIPDNDIDAAKELCRIFYDSRSDQKFEKQIEAAAWPFIFRIQEEDRLKNFGDLEKEKNKIITAYHEGYEKLLKDIEEKSWNYSFVKAAIAEIHTQYSGLRNLDMNNLLNRFTINKHPIAILAMIANHDQWNISDSTKNQVFQNLKEQSFKTLFQHNQSESKIPSAPSHIETFAGVTEGYWKDLKPKGNSYLIIKMENGNMIRNAGKNGEELKAEDVNGKFPVLDGIDYRSHFSENQLIYMEV